MWCTLRIVWDVIQIVKHVYYIKIDVHHAMMAINSMILDVSATIQSDLHYRSIIIMTHSYHNLNHNNYCRLWAAYSTLAYKIL